MNWLLILVILLLAWNIVKGFNKGLLRSVYSVVALVAIVVIAVIATPHARDFISSHTSIEKNIEKKSHEKISDFVVGDDNNKESNGELLREMGINIPDELADKLFESNSIADRLMEESGIYDEISEKIASLAMSGISFVLIILILVIAFHLLYQILVVIEEAPVIGLLNKIAGVGIGVIKGLIIVWVVYAVIAMNSTSEIGSYLIATTNTSPFLSLLYENNLVLILLMNFL